MSILVLLSLLAVSAAAPVSFYKSCDSEGQITSLDITPCTHSGPTVLCEFPKNNTVTLGVSFRIGTEITAAKPAVFGYLLGVKLPAPFRMEQDSCENFNSPCPLAANADYTYTTTAFVQPYYPSLRTVAEWQLLDQNGQIIFCFAVPVQIV